MYCADFFPFKSHRLYNFWENIFPSKYNVHFSYKAWCFGIIAVTEIESLQISTYGFKQNSLQVRESKYKKQGRIAVGNDGIRILGQKRNVCDIVLSSQGI